MLTLQPIGYVQSPYQEKFAVPRQPNLIKHGNGELHLTPPYNDPNCIKGLEQFTHLWLLFIFDRISGWHPTVRPPRLGGNQRIGVFASRSMFRPNPIGLSVVELKEVIIQQKVTILKLGSVDLVNNTPIIDIKPYLPFVDSQPQAVAGYAQHAPTKKLNVFFSEQSLLMMAQHAQYYPHLQMLVTELIEQDPRPAYRQQKKEPQSYAMHIYCFNIRWQLIHDDNAYVSDIELYGEE